MLGRYPFKEFRPGTEEALRKTKKAFESGKRFVLINAPTGCHAAGTKILMHDGTFKKVENISINEELMGPDGYPRKVLSLYRGYDEMYLITPKQGGRPFTVNGEHVLSLRSTTEESSNRDFKTKPADKYINISVNDYLNKSNLWKRLWNLYRVGICFDVASELPLDPYLFGLLLGSNSTTKRTKLTINSQEIEGKARQRMSSLGINKSAEHINGQTIVRSTTDKKEHLIINYLRMLKLAGCKYENKFVPHSYKVASAHDRLNILAGLLDVAGHLSDSNNYDYRSKSKRLAEDIAFISRSLGFSVDETLETVNKTEYYKLSISGDTSIVPVQLNRKKTSSNQKKKDHLITGFAIKPLNKGKFFGFELDKDHLYLLSDFTVTHNSGKSGLAVAFARKEHAIILTPSKHLQDQYENTKQFGLEYTIKGKRNYNCGLDLTQGYTVDEAICVSDVVAKAHIDEIPYADLITRQKKPGFARALKNRCAMAGVCPYYSKIFNIQKKPGAVLNYDLFFRIKPKPGKQSQFNLGTSLVMDEAHELLGKIQSIFGYQVSETHVTRLLTPEAERRGDEELEPWLHRILKIAIEKELGESHPSKASALSSFIQRLMYILSLGITDSKKFFIKDEGEDVEILPLDFRYLKEQLFHPFKKIMLLSATFPPNFRELFGITEEESEIIDIKSNFDVKNRPAIFVNNLPRLNYKTKLTKTHQTIKFIEEIIEIHQSQKGIIHCANYRIFKELKDIFWKDKRFTWVNRGDNKDQTLIKHTNTAHASILVSPSMMGGVDLKDDLARFQILVKMPYSALDDYTKKLMGVYPFWYNMLTSTNIVQAYGRAVRSSEDSAIFYILDGTFDMLYRKSSKMFPKYFTEALKRADSKKVLEVMRKKVQDKKQD